MLRRSFPCTAGILLLALAAVTARIPAQSVAPVLKIDGLGKGSALIDGPWQFHLGDAPAWAQPQTPDATGANGWEQITADNPWGAQGHRSYAGYAWYRKHLSLTTAPGASADLYLLFSHIDDVYEVYWNGRIVGHTGTMPPHGSYPFSPVPQIVHLGPAREGVLALRVWKAPLESSDSGVQGGMYAPPSVGSLDAVKALKTENDYSWLRGRQYYFGLQSLYGLVMLLSLLGWMRNRQPVLLAMAVFCFGPLATMVLVGLRLPFYWGLALGASQPALSLQDIGLWFLLLYLLELDTDHRLKRWAWILAIISFAANVFDGSLLIVDWSNAGLTLWAQWADALLTAVYTITEFFPFVLIGFALRKRLPRSRWFLAIAALVADMVTVLRNGLAQGSRFTNWTLGDKLAAPAFLINGNGFTPQTIANTILLIAIIYAVYRYMQDTLRRQGALEQELKSARELQQVLIPEALPEVAGFAVTSSYRPAQEVGGDFFQIIPLDGQYAGSTLILVGDVSGKGLRAAMTVSLIVGAVRTVVRFLPHPAEILAELNTRLYGRLQGAFATCLVLRLDPDGHCAVASAGHPAPIVKKRETGPCETAQREIDLPGSLPLGVVTGEIYQETTFVLREGDHLALYTDGLLEARNAKGEIFSFERLDALFSTFPSADEASDAAVNFGQDDDITVLTLTRLAMGEKSMTHLTAPALTGA